MPWPCMSRVLFCMGIRVAAIGYPLAKLATGYVNLREVV
jgi:hypothetical protein